MLTTAEHESLSRNGQEIIASSPGGEEDIKEGCALEV